MVKYQICSNCIMDTSDANIFFDERGWCDYCNNFHKKILPTWNPETLGQKEIDVMVNKIIESGKNKEHDCLLGISGGVDSSYLAYLAKEKFGLNPLIYHVDAGWNSQEAVYNIERIVDGLNLDLHTEVINWQEMRDLQLSYFKSQVPHLDTPQDHAFFASLYNFASKNGFKYILNGGNYSTECVREPLEWAYHASDLTQLKDIHSKFGERKLVSYPTADIFKYKLYYRFIKGVRVWRPLNCVQYIKEDAMNLLIQNFDWKKYEHKHYESRFTRFFEGYWLPTKFNFDKRRAHFSSLILTKQMTREEAIDKVSMPAFDKDEINRDFEYIAKKLGISPEELRSIHKGENKSWKDYKSKQMLIDLGTKALRLAGIQKAIIR